MRASIFISIIIYLIMPEMHVLMDNLPPCKIDLFLFADKMQDIQWYVKHNLEMLALIIFLFAVKSFSPKKVKPYIKCVIAIKVLEIPLYWLFYSRYDIGLIVLAIIITFLITKYNEKRINFR